MPREHQKRGRRDAGKKRKAEESENLDRHRHRKRHRFNIAEDEHLEFLPSTEAEAYDELDQYAPNRPLAPAETPFYGLLDEEEQEYFKRADDLLELNQFEGPEERNVFLANVYREAEGKELRLANSQSCSRLLERLILLSSPDQLKTLFRKFSGQLVVSCVPYNADADKGPAAFFISSNIDSPLTAAKLSLYSQPRSSPKNSLPASRLPPKMAIRTRWSSRWKTCFCIPSTNSKITSDIS